MSTTTNDRLLRVLVAAAILWAFDGRPPPPPPPPPRHASAQRPGLRRCGLTPWLKRR